VVFKWDPRKAAANLKKHRIDFHEAVTVLNDTLSTTFPDTDQSSVEPRFITIGMSTRGRNPGGGAYGGRRHGPDHQRQTRHTSRTKVL
jgi:Ribonuclease toxin, BrnT, of type II toxin-antitoxin system